MFLGREKEARDAARAALGQPAWTVGKDSKVIPVEILMLRSIDVAAIIFVILIVSIIIINMMHK